MRCCRKCVCSACITKVFQVQYVKQRFQVRCPFCRHAQHITGKRVKKLMAEHCLDHALVVDSEVGPVAVVHSPDAGGRYGDESVLQLVPTCLGDMVDELLSDIEELEEELAGSKRACSDLSEENARLRTQLEANGIEEPVD